MHNKKVWSYIEDDQIETYQSMWPVFLSNIYGVKNRVWVELVQYSTESIVTDYVEDQIVCQPPRPKGRGLRKEKINHSNQDQTVD